MDGSAFGYGLGFPLDGFILIERGVGRDGLRLAKGGED
jgi:hypothetical protein